MSTESPLEILHRALGSALYKDFSDIKYLSLDHFKYREAVNLAKDKGDPTPSNTLPEYQTEKTRRPVESHDIFVAGMFVQGWGSTALGFGGVGGQAMTDAYTIILECHGEYAVYFGGVFAYLVKNPNQTFHDDVAAKYISDVVGHLKYKSK